MARARRPNVGGPIRRNQVFFYGGYEGLRARTSEFASGNVPTQRLRDRSHAALQPFLSSLPLPTRATTNPDVGVFERVTRADRREDTATGRIDVHPSSNDTVFARYNRLDMTLEDEETIPGVSADDGLKHQVVTLAYTRILSQSMVNELRVGYNDYYHTKLLAGSSLPVTGSLRAPGLSLRGNGEIDVDAVRGARLAIGAHERQRRLRRRDLQRIGQQQHDDFVMVRQRGPALRGQRGDAFRIGEHDPWHPSLTDVCMAGAQRQQPFDHLLLLIAALQVEV